MISSPRPLLFTALLAVVGLLTVVIVAPSFESIWQRFDPLGHGVWSVRHAAWFTVPYRNDIGEIEQPIVPWRAVAASDAADSLFRLLAEESNPAAQLYALAGLTLRDSAAAATLRAELLRDTTTVIANLECREGGERRRTADVARLVATPAFATMLLRGSESCP